MNDPLFDYHAALSPLHDACRMAGYGFEKGLMDAWDPSAGAAAGNPLSVLQRKWTVALRHLRFASRVRNKEAVEPIVTREFSNVPLSLLFPSLYPLRNQLFFVVNHNLQWALSRPIERIAFRQLGQHGCRFVFWEQVPVDPLRMLGISSDNSIALPHPVSACRIIRERKGGVETIGIMGQYREEKGTDDLLEKLVALPWRILVGTPNSEFFLRHSAFSSHPRVQWKDTAGEDAYRATIAECDAIILSHPKESYQFRASGILADAAAAHVPVVARNLPVLTRQLTTPRPVGELFSQFDDLEDAILRADQMLQSGGYDFNAYGTSRSASVLAAKLHNIKETASRLSLSD